MTEEQQVVADIQAEIAKQPANQQDLIGQLAKTFRGVLEVHPGTAHLALVLVAAELAAEE